ncbi:MAG TPA: hypothetical protein VIH18_32190 [Candidatus Binatia bacterium]
MRIPRIKKNFFKSMAGVLALGTFMALLSPTIDAATLEKINASYGAISGSMAPIWVAKEAKLFEKHGLDLNLVYISGGPRAIMSLIGGSVQFVNHSGMPALEAYQRGGDTAMIASPMNQLEHSLVVQKQNRCFICSHAPTRKFPAEIPRASPTRALSTSSKAPDSSTS